MTEASAGDDFEEEVASTVTPATHSSNISGKNAFTELMKPKTKPKTEQTDEPSKRTIFSRRDGLAAYTIDPASFPPSRVIYYNDKFVVINDMFPKATVHLLILPRDPEKNVLRPQEAFDDPDFLAECQKEEKKVHVLAANELRRKLGKYSKLEQKRIQAMESDDLPDNDELPAGRDWSADIKSGTHANPSMNHLHIHVLSRDMVSEKMRDRNHYLSFTTDFLIPMDAYPLSKDDRRRRYGHFPDGMHCWRCGRGFGNSMKQLKDHLEKELEDWRTE